MGVLTHDVYWRVIGNSIALGIHSCNSLAMLVAMHRDTTDPDIIFLKNNQFKYITIWNVIFQILFLCMSLICDIPILMKIKKEDKFIGILRKYNNIFFGGVVWPTSALIFVIFWPIYIYDRELHFPAYIDKVLSQWSNHVMHTSILPIALWTLIFQPRNKPNSHKWYYLHLGTIFIGYFVFLIFDHSATGTWPYPLIKLVYGTVYFPLLLGLFAFIYIFLYNIQWSLTSYIHDAPKLKKK